MAMREEKEKELGQALSLSRPQKMQICTTSDDVKRASEFAFSLGPSLQH
jgi:hypothetical protein